MFLVRLLITLMRNIELELEQAHSLNICGEEASLSQSNQPLGPLIAKSTMRR